VKAKKKEGAQAPRKKPFRLKLGGVYRDAKKGKYGPMERTPRDHLYAPTHPYRCKVTGRTYQQNGQYFTHIRTNADLIREVVPRTPKASAKGLARSRPKTRNKQVTPKRPHGKH